MTDEDDDTQTQVVKEQDKADEDLSGFQTQVPGKEAVASVPALDPEESEELEKPLFGPDRRVERTDVGVSIRAEMVRGTGTRDEDSLRIEAKGHSYIEAYADFSKRLHNGEDASFMPRLARQACDANAKLVLFAGAEPSMGCAWVFDPQAVLDVGRERVVRSKVAENVAILDVTAGAYGVMLGDYLAGRAEPRESELASERDGSLAAFGGGVS